MYYKYYILSIYIYVFDMYAFGKKSQMNSFFFLFLCVSKISHYAN